MGMFFPHFLLTLFAEIACPGFSAQLEAGLESVRGMIGPEEQSGFTDSYIRDTLWDYNFDVEETLSLLAGMSDAHLPSTSPDPS
jgi:hypothetical protein